MPSDEETQALIDQVAAVTREDFLKWEPKHPQYIEGRVYVTPEQWDAIREAFPHTDPEQNYASALWGIPVEVIHPGETIRLPSGKELVHNKNLDALFIYTPDMPLFASGGKVFDAYDRKGIELLKRDPDAYFAGTRKTSPWQDWGEDDPQDGKDYPVYGPTREIWWTLGISLFALLSIVAFIVAHNQGWL